MYMPLTCNEVTHAPYVCNACPDEKSCRLDHFTYQANQAQKQYEKTLAKPREGINMTQEELPDLNELISPLVLKGQPKVAADHICLKPSLIQNHVKSKSSSFFPIKG